MLFDITNLLFISSFWIGLTHAFEVDHIAAVSNLVDSKSITKSILSGIKWGLGHSLIVIIVGLLLILFKVQVDEEFSHFFEYGVGFMLIILALFSLKHTIFDANSSHEHYINGQLVSHSHQLQNRSFLVGIVHGLAGSSSFTLLLIPYIKDKVDAIWYLGNFAIGSVIGMGIMSSIIAFPLKYTNIKIPNLSKILKISMGLIGLAVGIGVLIDSFNR